MRAAPAARWTRRDQGRLLRPAQGTSGGWLNPRSGPSMYVTPGKQNAYLSRRNETYPPSAEPGRRRGIRRAGHERRHEGPGHRQHRSTAEWPMASTASARFQPQTTVAAGQGPEGSASAESDHCLVSRGDPCGGFMGGCAGPWLRRARPAVPGPGAMARLLGRRGLAPQRPANPAERPPHGERPRTHRRRTTRRSGTAGR